jgi:hypothetical protein
MSKRFWGIISVVTAAAAVGAADVTVAPAGPLAAGVDARGHAHLDVDVGGADADVGSAEVARAEAVAGLAAGQ